jgi:transketolase
VYRTQKGWRYGIEGRASHGAGHKMCSPGFYEALSVLTGKTGISLPTCEAGDQRCMKDGDGSGIREECFWEALSIVREAVENSRPMVDAFVGRLTTARRRLDSRMRRPREGAPRVEAVYDLAATGIRSVPAELRLKPGTVTQLRAELGRVLQCYNEASGGAFFTAAADLLGSTSVNRIAAGFPEGYWNAVANPAARLLSIGGICEDAISGYLSGIAAFGHHIGVGASYGSFLAPLGHIAARLHAIGAQARQAVASEPYRPYILSCAHAGLKTGEDGPTHADPQPLQLLQDNFPAGTVITLTPWDPSEIWPLISAALARRPAVIAPFVTRPNEKVLDRQALGLAPAEEAANGVYLLREPRGRGAGTIVLQESAVTYAFIEGALPLLDRDGLDLWIYYVSSAELFDLLTPGEQRRIFPEARRQEAMGITGFTLATMYRWVCSEYGRTRSLHPYRNGHFLGSGQGYMVLAEAGLDGESQYSAIKDYVENLRET